MNRINQLFNNNNAPLLSIYFCAGTPQLNQTVKTLETLQKNGVNMVEIGIPFSDPMADGVVIQHAATKALQNGMSLKLLFEQLKDVRKTVTIPLVLMGYLNPIMQYGFKAFCESCRQCGIDAVIIPDLPFSDYMDNYKSVAQYYDLNVIMLITPETSQERIKEIDANTDGFIYMVSSAATTGTQSDFDKSKIAYFDRINKMNLKHPRMIGFGLSNAATFSTACQYAQGGIIGSLFVSLLEQYNDPSRAIQEVKSRISVS